MKFIFLTLVFLVSIVINNNSWTQDCGQMDYLAKGNSWVLTQYNKLSKVTGHTDYTILDERTVNGNREWDIKTVMKDKKDVELSSATATAICDGEKILLDFQQVMQSDTFKILQISVVEMDIVKTETSSIDWYALGFGIVKSEYYNKRGKLTGLSEITSFTKG